MLRAVFLLFIAVSAIVSAAGYTNRPTILVNGHFQTMDANNSVVAALGVYSGLIRAAGDRATVIAAMSQFHSELPWYSRVFGLRSVDLEGQSVLPGFVDAHSHFPASGIAGIGLDLSSPPFGRTKDIPALLQSVSKQAQQQSDKRWIIGFNYDDAGLREERHPTRSELDHAAPDHPVYLRHRSGHMGVANSEALQALGHEQKSGLLREKAAPGMHRLIQEIPWWHLPAILFRARDEYLHAGVTTLQNGFTDKQSLQVLRYAAKLGLIPQRVLVWPAHDKLDATPDLSAPRNSESVSSGERLAQAINWPLDDRRRIAIGAIKLIADGSPQGRTAWLSKPYLNDKLLGDGYRGHANVQEKLLHELILKYHRAGFQLALHGNGDAAIQSIIDGLQKATTQYPRDDARHFIVHAQTISPMQLQALSALEVSVSFFPTHTYYWGDWYRRRVLGRSRASMISPLASADTAGVRYTIHADSPVTPIDPMQMLWSATERLTSSGFLLGAEQRVSRLRALRAMTIDAAWQNHLDHDRGSLEVGKLADFVVMSDNPLTASDVRDIAATEVWIGGKRRFQQTAE